MNIYCLTGLHVGVWQGLDETCKHTFYVPHWPNTRPKPDNIKLMTQEQIDDPDESFFDAILIFPEHYHKVANLNKTIICYFVMNGRQGQINDYTANILANPRVIPVFVSTSCRTSHNVFDGPHRTIYPGIDENWWNGYVGDSATIVHCRNSFKDREPTKYAEYKWIVDTNKDVLIGSGGDKECSMTELRDEFRKHRLFLNIEIFTSTFSISSMEAMMTGMPIICNDIEGTGEAIRNGIEGYASNNLGLLKIKVRELLNDHAMAKELGQNARKMAQIKFGTKQFNAAWNDLLDNINHYRRV